MTKASRRAVGKGLLAAAASTPMALLTAHAEMPAGWPSRPIRIIVPFPPGGSLDQIARLVQPVMQRELKQTVLVDNKAGASGSIGTAAAAASPPDGYTIVMVFDTHGVNSTLIAGLSYDTLNDFAPITKIGRAPMVLAVHPAAPYNTFTDLVAAAKAAPGKVPYGTVGQGSLAHLTMTQVGNSLGAPWIHVPYKGGAPLNNDILAGHIPAAIQSIAAMGPHIKAGKLRALAMTSPERHPQFPDTPTIAEAGPLPGFSANAWWGLLAPAKTPPEIVARFNEVVKIALNEPSVKTSLVDNSGLVYEISTPAEFGAFITSEVQRWAKVVKDNKIAPE